jgi:hypothetical protein
VIVRVDRDKRLVYTDLYSSTGQAETPEQPIHLLRVCQVEHS